VNKYVIPAIRHVKLQELSPLAVNEMYAKWTKERGFSPRHVIYTHAVLHHALEQAVDWGLLTGTTRRATLPRKVHRAPTVLNAEQIIKLLEAAQNDSLRSLWCLLLTSGLRPGEAVALRWSDLNDGAITVRRSLVSDGKGHYSVAESQAKTKESILSVSLPCTTLEAFKTHRARQNAEMLLAGERHQRQDFTFAGKTGAWLSPDNVRKAVEDAVEAGRVAQGSPLRHAPQPRDGAADEGRQSRLGVGAARAHRREDDQGCVRARPT